jgi:hypothetical protein
MVGGRVKLLPAEVNKWGSDFNSGQFILRRTASLHRNWTLTPICDPHAASLLSPVRTAGSEGSGIF